MFCIKRCTLFSFLTLFLLFIDKIANSSSNNKLIWFIVKILVYKGRVSFFFHYYYRVVVICLFCRKLSIVKEVPTQKYIHSYTCMCANYRKVHNSIIVIIVEKRPNGKGKKIHSSTPYDNEQYFTNYSVQTHTHTHMNTQSPATIGTSQTKKIHEMKYTHTLIQY